MRQSAALVKRQGWKSRALSLSQGAEYDIRDAQLSRCGSAFHEDFQHRGRRVADIPESMWSPFLHEESLSGRRLDRLRRADCDFEFPGKRNP